MKEEGTVKFWHIGAAILAAGILALLWNWWSIKEALPDTPYHNSNLETLEVFDYATEQDLLDGLAYPSEAGQTIEWSSRKDGWSGEACSGTTNGSGGLFVAECCGDVECLHTPKATVADVKSWISARIP